jgi:EAL domain-containing protein (putative c-di-GMP-specific phosphodiesterase class I)
VTSCLPLTWTGPRSTVELAHSRGLTLVAEGVENDTALLARLGWDVAQGYHISRLSSRPAGSKLAPSHTPPT